VLKVLSEDGAPESIPSATLTDFRPQNLVFVRWIASGVRVEESELQKKVDRATGRRVGYD
jgi:hypothetical protein